MLPYSSFRKSTYFPNLLLRKRKHKTPADKSRSMAELTVYSLADKVLSAAASPALKLAYEKCLSIWEARDELDKLQVTIESIVAVLLDAEKKQEGSVAVKNWIKRLKGVLYDAEDLFDEVATEELLKQQIMKKGNSMLSKKVQVYSSKLNPIISRNSVANKVKAIRKRLFEVSRDMAGLGFVRCHNLEEGIPTGMRTGQDPGSFIDSKDVIGRDDDKRVILEMVLQEGPFVIAIVGIGGMGKTTLAQLIYNDVEVEKNFANRWFSCISDVSDDIEVLGKIFQSICGQHYSGFTVSQLHTRIRESTEGKKFLLVLDDVWDDNRGRWLNRMSLLGGGAIGSRIIVTTRSPFVAMTVDALKTHNLDGLSEEDSWDLFKKIAFAPGNEDDLRRIDLGKEIVKKCRNVPLAIRSIASLLFEKNSIQEWESIRNEELSKLGQSHEDGIMPVLKLSYNHLPSNLKQCFASCSLFPKNYRLLKLDLVYHWIAQGYIRSNDENQTLEDVSNSYFMYLLRRGFFQEVQLVQVHGYKMHDLLVDLALHVACEESTVLTTCPSRNISPRHVSVEYIIDGSWAIPAPLLNLDGLRSFMFMNDGSWGISSCIMSDGEHTLINGGSICGATLGQLFANFKLLRTLTLRRLEIKKVPNSIGELKHLRNIDLSYNKFERLPNSITNLVNLLRLVLEGCSLLKELPDSFGKLISLRNLNIKRCHHLKYMPPGMGGLNCLQYLSDFKVGKEREGVKMSGFDALTGLLLRLRGELVIGFEAGIDNWDDDQCWKLPQSLQVLMICDYPGTGIPHWVNETATNVLTSLSLSNCLRVKYLPPLRCLPNLKHLSITGLKELEYVEDQEGSFAAAGSTFFPCLENLDLLHMPKLKGWRRKTAANPPILFLFLYELRVVGCPEFYSVLLCPRVHSLHLWNVDCDFAVQHILSPSLEFIDIAFIKGLTKFSDEALPSLRRIKIFECNDLKIVDLASSDHLEKLFIYSCRGIRSFRGERLASLRSLTLINCNQLKDLHIEQLNSLNDLSIERCPELELWEEGKRCVDWDSLPNLSYLSINSVPPPELLPDSLRRRQAAEKLTISIYGLAD